MDLLYAVKASVPGILHDLYYVSKNEQSAIQVAARISCIDTAKAEIEEYEVPILTEMTNELYYLYMEDLILNAQQRSLYTQLDCQSFQLDRFYIDGIHGVTCTTTTATNRLNFSYEEFLKDNDMVPDFGQGVGELYQELLNEYTEKTGLTIDAFHVVDELWGSYDRADQGDDGTVEETTNTDSKEEQQIDDDTEQDNNNNNDILHLDDNNDEEEHEVITDDAQESSEDESEYNADDIVFDAD